MIGHLLMEIAREGAKLSIKYDKEKDDLYFFFSINGEQGREVLHHSDTELVNDQNELISHVLIEILSIIRGLKEEM